VLGITTLANIANSAINAGKRLVSSLTIDPVKMGFQEYETKVNAIQTILTNTASKGTTLQQVNDTLNELNTYADKTIYNFSEMTRNIGTFTAAGIGLKESATAIKGIANLAAGSGSNAQQASTAMYQLSQALAAGSVKLMDWNSVVNAGMGGELFQNALKKTAKEMGIVVDASVPFRESLQSGWITSEVLTKTLAKFAEDKSLLEAATQVKTFTQMLDTMKESVQSGWAQSWESIIGNKNEAASFFTAINDGFTAIVGSSANARNEMLKFWHDNGGRDAIIDALSNAFNTLQSVLKPIKEAFREVFPAMTGQRLVEISKGIRDLTENFKIGDKTADNIKSTFKGLFAVLDIGKKVIVGIITGLGNLIKYLLPVGDGFLSFTGTIGDFLVSIDETVGKIINIFDSLGTANMAGLDSFSERVKTRFEPLTKLSEFVHEVFTKIANVVKKVAPVFYSLASLIGGAFDKLRINIVNALDNADFNSVFDIVNGGLFAGILLGL
jgi:tape measure domain-containing protein